MDFFKKFINYGLNLYKSKYQIFNYLIVGALTTAVCLGAYVIASKYYICGFNISVNYLFNNLFQGIFNLDYGSINLIKSNIISWIVAVTFAYYTNRCFVFNSNKSKDEEYFKFVSSRLITLVLETIIMILFVNYVKMNDVIVKLIVQFVVIIGNYFISKFLVFK